MYVFMANIAPVICNRTLAPPLARKSEDFRICSYTPICSILLSWDLHCFGLMYIVGLQVDLGICCCYISYGSVFNDYNFTYAIIISVLYSTLLAQAQNEDEKNEIEKKMESDPELKQILDALQATDKEDIVTEERARRQQDRRSRVAADIAAMDTDDNQVGCYYE